MNYDWGMRWGRSKLWINNQHEKALTCILSTSSFVSSNFFRPFFTLSRAAISSLCIISHYYYSFTLQTQTHTQNNRKTKINNLALTFVFHRAWTSRGWLTPDNLWVWCNNGVSVHCRTYQLFHSHLCGSPHTFLLCFATNTKFSLIEHTNTLLK